MQNYTKKRRKACKCQNFFVLLTLKRKNVSSKGKKKQSIKAIKYIIRFLVCLFLGIYILLLTLSAIPAVQRWAGKTLSTVLEEKIGTKARIENVSIGMMGRVILDNVKLYDQKDSLMLDISRIAAKVEIAPLLNKTVRINNAQLIGAKAKLYQEKENEPMNFQFLLDAFASKDTTSSPLDLQIGTLLVRRSSIRLDKLYCEETPGIFSPNHIHINDLSITAKVQRLTNDSINVTLKKLAFNEESGLSINKVGLELKAGLKGFKLKDFILQTQGSEIAIPSITASYETQKLFQINKKCLQDLTAEGVLTARIKPSDIKALIPKIKDFDDIIHISLQANINKNNISVHEVKVHDSNDAICLEGEAYVTDFTDRQNIAINIVSLKTSDKVQDFLRENILGEQKKRIAEIDAIGETITNGTIRYYAKNIEADLQTKTSIGELKVDGKLSDMNALDANISVANFSIAKLLNKSSMPDVMTAGCNLKGIIKDNKKQIDLRAEGLINELVYNNYPYKDIAYTVSANNNEYNIDLTFEDINGNASIQANLDMSKEEKKIFCTAEVTDFSPYNMNLTKKHESERFSGRVEADVCMSNIDNINGNVNLIDICFESADGTTFMPGDLTITSETEDEEQHLRVSSPFLSLNIDGKYKWNDLYTSILENTHYKLPSIIPAPTTTTKPFDNEIEFMCKVQDTTLIKRLTGVELSIPEEAIIQGNMDDDTKRLTINASIPNIIYGGNQLQHTQISMESNEQIIQTSINTERLTEDAPVELILNAYAKEGKIKTNFSWDNHLLPQQKGNISIVGRFIKDMSDKQGIEANVENSSIIINDTAWSVSPALISYHDNVIDISNLKVHNGERYLKVNGRVSKEETDTLTADLKEISISYILNIVDFHSVDFDGKATGKVYASKVLDKPNADIFLNVKDFTFNNGYMGNMDVYGNYGKHDKSITLDATMRDLAANHETNIQGSITPGRGPGTGLDLNIKTRRINLFFLNKFTSGIFTNFQGRATGWARVFGPFKSINLEGDLLVDEAQMHINVLGTDYRMERDSVILRPDNIWIRNATAFDYLGSNGSNEHSAIVNGHLMHNNLKRLRYDIYVEPRNLLSYNTNSKSGQNFYGTVYATGNLHLVGEPGSLNVDINATPESGTTIIYNVASPDAITEAGFIKYVNHSDSTQLSANREEEEEEETTSDIRLNFNLNITPEATLKLIMDQRSGDYINLNGNAHILANYYNKGKFQMYGTYHVERGVYKLSMQDFIRKDFQFQPGGSIVFGGNAMQAALNLKAVYTVPNVSLDDLSYSGLGLSNTRVDCIMNIGGKPEQPAVTFDFDLPNANEDEKQMVRSMVSTEEERNMQIIYLLGIGRFYNVALQESSGASRQSSMAMNSLLSSTLTGQFNQILSNAMGGNNNWNFGTNLRTGEEGWNQLDVEGMLSGRLLNNRLLFNGNFGYRESYYSTNNFIGDFDIQYILNKARTLSLKAYNQTNDRYFIQSSLTTQGIGLKFQRDFNNWREMFPRQNKRAKKN